jgi:methyltransferase-like protein
MLKAIQQEVTIQPGGIVTLHSPELESGLRANVIVIMTEKSLPSQQPNDVMQKASLRELLENVAAEKERMTLTYRKKVFLAVVPIEDIYLIEELEECIDRADVNDALQETLNTGTISSEQLDKELGW